MRRRSRKARILAKLGTKTIVLVGMMGCGKSAIGKMVANRLGLEFRDADTEIELAADRSVAEIFSDYGEEEFRRLEERVIERLLKEEPMVLALGGGAFMSQDTRQIISNFGLSIWLKVDFETLFERVMRKPGKRPLLATENPANTLKELMTKREPVYAMAELHVDSVPGTKSVMRDRVLDELDKYLNTSELERQQ